MKFLTSLKFELFTMFLKLVLVAPKLIFKFDLIGLKYLSILDEWIKTHGF